MNRPTLMHEEPFFHAWIRRPRQAVERRKNGIAFKMYTF